MIEQDPDQPTVTNEQELLATYLAELDEACPLCSYNLRGLTGHHCPECGKALVLRVGLEEPNLGPYIAGLISISSAIGFCFLMMMFFLIIGVIRTSLPSASLYFWATGLGFLFSVSILLLWMRSAKRIRKMQRKRSVMLAIGTLLVPIACFLAFLWAYLND